VLAGFDAGDHGLIALAFFGFSLDTFDVGSARPCVEISQQVTDHLPGRRTKCSVAGHLIDLYIIIEMGGNSGTPIKFTDKRGEIEYVEKAAREVGSDDRVCKLRSRRQRIRH
jgi:hypothetical protein